MNEADLRRLLTSAELPSEQDAERRSWALVRTEFKQRERISWPRRRARALLALGVAVALLAGALTPPGRALAERLRDAVSEDAPEPITLPAAGRLLVVSDDGPWIVQRDGSKRLLGAYDDAVWSPRGLFVAATRGRTLVTLEPNGRVRWTLTRPAPVSQPRWSPSGFRIAYRSGRVLRVVAGDGTGDRLLSRSAGTAAVAWQPGTAHVLAYTNERGRVNIVDTDTGRLVAARAGRATAPVRELTWTSDGLQLIALAGQSALWVFSPGGQYLGTVAGTGARGTFATGRPEPDVFGHTVRDLVVAPTGSRYAFTAFDARTRRTSVLVGDRSRKNPGIRIVFTGAGRFDGIAWSPDGRWLLAGWADADQWVFIRVPDVQQVLAVPAVSGEFDPGGSGQRRFPRVVSWCC